MPAPVWTAPVRFVEVDSQGVVFNAHYLTWCDEAMAVFLAGRSTPTLDLSTFSTRVRLVTSTLTWRRSATWGDTVDVDVRCTALGRSSLTLEFDIDVDHERCCTVTTVYVNIGPDDRPAALPDDVRLALAP